MLRNLSTLMMALLVAVVFSLTGCGGGGNSSNTSATTLKRSVILFPNSDSSIYYVDSAPDGTGIVASRGGTGAILSMDILAPDGAYYKLTFGSAGLPSISLAGYKLTAVATDSNGNITQAKITEPNGTSTTYTSKYSIAKIADPLGAMNSVSKIAFMTGAGNPECGAENVDSPDFPRSYGCNIALEARDPTWQVVNSLLNWGADLPTVLAAKYPTLAGLARKGIDAVSGVKNELSQASDNLTGYNNVVSGGISLSYSSDTRNLTGTSESAIRNLIADARTLGNDPNSKNLSTIDASKLQSMNYYHLSVTSVTPSAAKLNELTTFYVNGPNLKYGVLDFKLENCYGISELNDINSTQRRFQCIPTVAGTLKGSVKNYAYPLDSLFKEFTVAVSGNPVLAAPANLPAPTNFKVTKTGSATWSMNWDAVAGATEYYAFQKSGSAHSVTPGRYKWQTLFDDPDFIDWIPGDGALTDSDTVYSPGTYYWVVVAAREDPADPNYVYLGNAPTPASLTFTSTSTTPTQTTKGVMSLTVPWGGLTEFKFPPDAPYSFYMNSTMASIGIIQSSMVFKSETQITATSGAYSTGPIRITVTEPSSTDTHQDISIRFDSAASNGVYGELVPVTSTGSFSMCHVSGTNSQNYPSCASLGIAFNKSAGTLTFTNTSLYPQGISNIAPTKITSLSLSFTPY